MFKTFRKHLKERKRAKAQQSIVGMKGFDFMVTPRQGFRFYNDYFKIDHCYATILTFFHRRGANHVRKLIPMWGCNLLPQGLGQGVSTHLLIGMNALPNQWVKKHLDNMDDVVSVANGNSMNSNHTRSKLLSIYRREDLDQVNEDIVNSDSYFKVDFKLLIKAKSLHALDSAFNKLMRMYDNYLDGGFYLHAFDGQQYDDLSNIMHPATQQIGKNYMFTAGELAGVYNIVSHGINDEFGDYCGISLYDINNSAVIWDMNKNFGSHAIIAANQRAVTNDRYSGPSPRNLNNFNAFPKNTLGSSMWGVKLAQSTLADNHKVVHLVLNNADIRDIGTDLSNITSYIPMNKGAINPFEIFGDRKHELTKMAAHTVKLRLMARQLVPELNSVDLGKYFTNVVNDFYRDKHMLVHDPAHHRALLRLVGLPHNQYPLLHDFCIYLDEAEKWAANDNNQEQVKSLEKIESAFNRMKENADLFDRYTDSNLNGVNSNPQVIYDFSDLMQRGIPVAMCQFINAIAYATSNLQRGDLLIVHGTEQITGGMKGRYSVKNYFASVIETLRKRGVRVAYLYDNIDKMLDDSEFNRFDSADWVLTGYMSHNLILKYQKKMNQHLPIALAKHITTENPSLYYLRRGLSNVLFASSPSLDYNNHDCRLAKARMQKAKSKR